jgi:hypothetical protein
MFPKFDRDFLTDARQSKIFPLHCNFRRADSRNSSCHRKSKSRGKHSSRTSTPQENGQSKGFHRNMQLFNSIMTDRRLRREMISSETTMWMIINGMLANLGE